MRQLSLNLSKQLITITIVSLLIMVISISIVLPKSLEPFFEQTVYSYLKEPLEVFENQAILNKENLDIAYIISKDNTTYISSNYKEILKVDDYKELLNYVKDRQGSFIYNSKKYYYSKKLEKGNEVIAITTDNYIKMLRSDFLGIIIPIIVVTYIVILILLIFWSNYIVNRLEKLKVKIDNINNEKYNAKTKYKIDDEITLLDETIDEMKEIILSQEKYKSEMYQNISHDFKTPITVIKSYIEAYNDGIENHENVIKISDEQIKKLEKQVKTLLELNKITYLQNSYKNDTKIKLLPIMESIIDKYKIIDSNINYKIICDKKEILYNGNEEIWDSIVNNIMSNAIRYAKKEIIITIKEDKVIFFDDGEKIEKEILDKMFEPYKKGKKGENGIGLSIVKRNCNLIGYGISAKNKKNGVEFIISKRN